MTVPPPKQTCRERIPLLGFVTIFLPCILVAASDASGQDIIRLINGGEDTHFSIASVVDDVPLIHTRMLLPTAANGIVEAKDVSHQLHVLISKLTQVLAESGSTLQGVVKINFYVADKLHVEPALAGLSEQWSLIGRCPPVTFVVSKLAAEDAFVALDCVAVAVPGRHTLPDTVKREANWSFLPSGRRLYVSGQAERGESLEEATRLTLAMLQRTLESLNRSNDDIVQLKAFVMPMTKVSVVEDAVKRFYAPQTAPPLVTVDWKSSATTPIEIELIAHGGMEDPSAAVVDHLWLPWMTQSPVYCRVVRINHGPTIFIGGLHADHSADNSDPNSPRSGEREVRSVFAQLDSVLRSTQSDLEHLVKATYYVSTEAASAKLNELRPKFYNPRHPPAASKAVVESVGVTSLGLTVDMIAVPRTK